MKPKPIRMISRAAVMLLMCVLTATTAGAADITQNTAVVINSGNKAQYNNKSVAGNVPGTSYAGNIDTFISRGAIVVDGIELNLTIDGLNVDYSEQTTPLSGISLVNGAKLHLTVNGTNTLKAGYGGAGIAVPFGCSLEITAASTGTLNATGGRGYGGGAGIGSRGNGSNTNQTNNQIYPQGCGDITINGGTVNAQGGTWYYNVEPSGGAAGIGSSEYSGWTVSGVTFVENTPITYNITYNTNGGTMPDSYATTYNIESVNITLPTPTRKGYTFAGWYANEGLTDPAVTSITHGSTGDKQFWAKWTANTYTVQFDGNGNTDDGDSDVTPVTPSPRLPVS